MARMFTSGFKPKSTTKEAKKIIREEILDNYNPKDFKGAKTPLDAMKQNADAGNGGVYGKRYVSDYQKGAYLVDAGEFRISYYDQGQFLSQIYGKENVAKWEGQKIHETYKHLIGREYNAMLREREKNNYKSNSRNDLF